MRVHTPVVISCNENRREVAAVQNIANKQIDRTFLFDRVCILILKLKEHNKLMGFTYQMAVEFFM